MKISSCSKFFFLTIMTQFWSHSFAMEQSLSVPVFIVENTTRSEEVTMRNNALSAVDFVQWSQIIPQVFAMEQQSWVNVLSEIMLRLNTNDTMDKQKLAFIAEILNRKIELLTPKILKSFISFFNSHGHLLSEQNMRTLNTRMLNIHMSGADKRSLVAVFGNVRKKEAKVVEKSLDNNDSVAEFASSGSERMLEVKKLQDEFEALVGSAYARDEKELLLTEKRRPETEQSDELARAELMLEKAEKEYALMVEQSKVLKLEKERREQEESSRKKYIDDFRSYLQLDKGPMWFEVFKKKIIIDKFMKMFDLYAIAFTTLHFAAMFGDLEYVRALLEQGADIESKGVIGEKPLQLAITYGQLEVVEELLEWGANTAIRDRRSKLHLLQDAVRYRNVALVKLLLDYKANHTIRTLKGSNLLHEAAKRNSDRESRDTLEIVRMLIASGLEIDLKNNEGATPLFRAVRFCQVDVVKEFFENGADKDIRDANGDSLLHKAAVRGDLQVLKEIFVRGADVKVRNRAGETPLHTAAKGSSQDAITLLVVNGADIEAADNEGKTALHHAAKAWNMHAIKTLVSLGAKKDCLTKGSENVTAKELAEIELKKWLSGSTKDCRVPLAESHVKYCKEIVEALS